MLLGISCWTGAATEDTSPANTTRELQIDFEPGVVFNQPQCVVENGFDYSGNDIGSAPAPTPWDCCVPCSSRPGCNAYTWTDFNDGTCWFKSGRGTINVNSAARSAIMSDDAGSATCGLENGVDYAGNDIGSARSSTAGGCCSICRNFGGCRAFSWTNTDGGTCWLKNRKDATVRRDGVISGKSTANPPAPSCAMEQNVDYDGATSGNARSTDPYGCCSICMRTANCRAFSWNNFEGGTCWLKSARGTAIQRAGVFSSVV
ncbi:hypothetical protein JG688_00010424 [Phytophthora aleatoria]|uniref:Apple domain-containing protein n=1 Tax=Phytophthora aleatoria TaxID=2496075 RepID=A0A8J5J511_9STRA|nr:hypothetical protein JG688_00010424 [Phytophthora aleatoria]